MGGSGAEPCDRTLPHALPMSAVVVIDVEADLTIAAGWVDPAATLGILLLTVREAMGWLEEEA
jgi:hypothetical protein